MAFSVYGLYCECHRSSGVRYVGKSEKSVKSRFSSHLRNAIRITGGSDIPVYRWIRKHGTENMRYTVLGSYESSQDVRVGEMHWISYFRAIKSDMLNVRNGGDDRLGLPLSEEAKRNLSLKMSGRKTPWNTGERNHSATLDESMVRDIRDSGRARSELAEKYGVSYTAIYNVQVGKTWKHVDGGLQVPKHRKTSPEKITEVQKYLSEGLSGAETARRAGVGRDSVYRIARRAGVALKPHNPRAHSAETAQEIKKLLAQGKSGIEISTLLGVPQSKVSEVRKGVRNGKN